MRTDAPGSIGFSQQAAGSRRWVVAGIAVAGVLVIGIVTAGCSGTGTRSAATTAPGTAAAVNAAIASPTPAASVPQASPTPAISAPRAAAGSPTPAAAATPKAAKKKKKPAAGDGAAEATPQPGAATPTPAAGSGGKSDRRAELQSVLQQVDASTIVAGFKKRSLPISSSTALNAGSDPDGQLGKPGQYTSKVTFADSRIANNDASGIAAGGAIEVFSSQADATRRKNELTKAATANGANSEMDFQRGTIILRLSPQLAADQVSEYETTVNLVLRSVRKQSAKHATPATTPTATPPPPSG